LSNIGTNLIKGTTRQTNLGLFGVQTKTCCVMNKTPTLFSTLVNVVENLVIHLPHLTAMVNDVISDIFKLLANII